MTDAEKKNMLMKIAIDCGQEFIAGSPCTACDNLILMQTLPAPKPEKYASKSEMKGYCKAFGRDITDFAMLCTEQQFNKNLV